MPRRDSPYCTQPEIVNLQNARNHSRSEVQSLLVSQAQLHSQAAEIEQQNDRLRIQIAYVQTHIHTLENILATQNSANATQHHNLSSNYDYNTRTIPTVITAKHKVDLSDNELEHNTNKNRLQPLEDHSPETTNSSIAQNKNKSPSKFKPSIAEKQTIPRKRPIILSDSDDSDDEDGPLKNVYNQHSHPEPDPTHGSHVPRRTTFHPNFDVKRTSQQLSFRDTGNKVPIELNNVADRSTKRAKMKQSESRMPDKALTTTIQPRAEPADLILLDPRTVASILRRAISTPETQDCKPELITTRQELSSTFGGTITQFVTGYPVAYSSMLRKVKKIPNATQHKQRYFIFPNKTPEFNAHFPSRPGAHGLMFGMRPRMEHLLKDKNASIFELFVPVNRAQCGVNMFTVPTSKVPVEYYGTYKLVKQGSMLAQDFARQPQSVQEAIASEIIEIGPGGPACYLFMRARSACRKQGRPIDLEWSVDGQEARRNLNTIGSDARKKDIIRDLSHGTES
ncbi:hypothetical protein F5877DRAFT_64740 [Lentinula edodes]|nr:hypothetical protein F5877DRAFT_64740 [Lentinula edodes]